VRTEKDLRPSGSCLYPMSLLKLVVFITVKYFLLQIIDLYLVIDCLRSLLCKFGHQK